MYHLEIAVYGETAYCEMQLGVDTKRHSACFVQVSKTKTFPVLCCVSHGVQFQTVKTRQAVTLRRVLTATQQQQQNITYSLFLCSLRYQREMCMRRAV